MSRFNCSTCKSKKCVCPPGPTGATGPQGFKGDQGLPGTNGESAARVRAAQDTPLTPGVTVTLSFDPGFVAFDTGTPNPYFDPIGFPTRLTAATTGKYLVVGQVNFSAVVDNPTPLLLTIQKNSSINVARSSNPSVGSFGIDLEVSTIIDLAAGEYVELLAHTVISPTVVTAITASSPVFSITRVAP